jgi:hypothetical protein
MYGQREERLPDSHCSLMKTTCGEGGRAGKVDMYPSAHSITSQFARRIIADVKDRGQKTVGRGDLVELK